jgi:hypothetical protein
MAFTLAGLALLPAQSSAYAYRWTDPVHSLFPASALQGIQTLPREAAQQAYSWGSELASSPAAGTPTVSLSDLSDEDATTQWLEQHLPNLGEETVLLWGPSHGVVVQSGLFAARWPSFCYPASDDVMVIALSEAWLLRYSHEETFHLWVLRPLGGLAP